MDGPKQPAACLPDIYVDLDGVLADYDLGYLRLTGGQPGEKGALKAARLKPFPRFFRDLPLMLDAMQLWSYLKPYQPSILSAASNWVPASHDDKRDWVARHFQLAGPKVIIVDNPNQKYKYCTQGAVLVDDNSVNCLAWEKASGIPILHKSAAETIRQFEAVLSRSGPGGSAGHSP
jgi:5'(3')-deoxyribonucleotidase